MLDLLFYIVAAAVTGGSVAPFAKLALEVFPPFTLVALRFGVASLAMLPFVARGGQLSRAGFRSLLGTAAIGALNPILLFVALQFTASSVSPLIYAGLPMMTALYYRAVLRRPIAPRQALGIGVGFAGTALIVLLPLFQHGGLDRSGLWGNLLIVGAALSFMVYGVRSKEHQQQRQVSPLALTFYLSLATLLAALPLAALELARRPLDLTAVQPRHLLAALAVGVVGTFLFYLAYQQAIQRGSELSAALFTYLQPVVGILFSVWLLGETLTPAFVVGGTLAVLGAQLAAGRLGRRPAASLLAVNRPAPAAPNAVLAPLEAPVPVIIEGEKE